MYPPHPPAYSLRPIDVGSEDITDADVNHDADAPSSIDHNDRDNDDDDTDDTDGDDNDNDDDDNDDDDMVLSYN